MKQDQDSYDKITLKWCQENDTGNNFVYCFGACYPMSNTLQKDWKFKLVTKSDGERYFYTNIKDALMYYSILRHHSGLYVQTFKTYMTKKVKLILNECNALPENLVIPERPHLNSDDYEAIEKFCTKI